MSTIEDPALAQRLAALEVANAQRTAAADVKKRIAAGLVYLDEVLTGMAGDDQDAADSLTMTRLLLSAPRIGTSKAKRIISHAQVPSDRRVRDLLPSQRHRMAQTVRAYAPWTTAAGR